MKTGLQQQHGQERRALLAERLRLVAQKPRRTALSFAQQRLWFLDQLEPESPLYNVAILARIAGTLEVSALEAAINAVIKRHEALRTTFINTDTGVEQLILPSLKLGLQKVELVDCADPEAQARRLIGEEVKRPFDLATGPLLRATLITFKPGEYRLLLLMHHIVADEWSLKIFFNEMSRFYSGLVAGGQTILPDLAIQYADYAEWQRRWLKGELLEKQLQYWRERLGHNPPVTELATDRPRSPRPTFRGTTLVEALPPELTQAVRTFVHEQNSTLFMVLLAAFKAVLFRHTGQTDLVIGTPVAGRTRVETENLIGFFVNTLLVRSSAEGNPTFAELLARVREASLGAFAHQDLPFDKLVEELQPERSLNHMPFARIMFVLQNGFSQELAWPGATFRFEEVHSELAKFDLTFAVRDSSEGLSIQVEYNSDLFDSETIQRLTGHFRVLLEAALAAPQTRLSDLPWLTWAERHQLLVDWNQTSTDYPKHKCIHELVEAWAERTPEAVAVRFGASAITYGELNRRANQLANYLRHCGVGPEVLVCVCVHRSISMVIALLGILKAGGAYVPLDPRYPKERLEFMLQDSKANILLTETGLVPRLPPHQGKIVCLDTDWELIAREGTANLPSPATAENLAYVMYTSGSTGQPKGVAVPHRAVNRLVLNTNFVSLDPTDRMAQVSNFSFDAATFEIWGALLNGAQLVGITRGVALSPKEFARELKEARITVMFLTSALFSQLAAEVPGAFEHIKTLLAGGEALDPKWVRAVLANRPPKRLLNGYGPTENTTFTCCHEIRSLSDSATNVPIGRPIANTQVYILDEQRRPVAVGVAGQLYTGGDGLARGYWDRPEHTADTFVPNPFGGAGASPLLYRTGDLARYLPDGTIEFLRRVDNQVKLRGFRIELGEIETVLGQHRGVRDCVVSVKGKGASEKKLVAYVVPAAATTPNASELRSFLSERLPDYMIPAAFMPLAALPLTGNGKVDRKALPEPQQARPELEGQYLQPADEVEQGLVNIWENVLNVRPIGIQDKFFDLGGHSLLAVRVISQIEKRFGRKLKLATIFQAPTVQQLAAVLRQEIKETSLGQSGSLVEIQSKGSQPPLYLVHGAGGGMFWGYVNLARQLGLQQPVYGFKSRGLEGRPELDDIPMLAAQYVADLRKLQPHGPYYLGGYCFGGVVAYEMACQLSAAGEPIAFVGLLNCAPPNSRYTTIPWTPRWAARFLRNLVYWAGYCRQWTRPQRREFLRWKWSLLKKRFGRGMAAQQRAALAPGDLVDLSGFTEDQKRVWEAHIRALIKYKPEPYAGQVHLFRSPGHPLWCSFDPDYGWGDLAKGGVEITPVPGAHEKILEEGCVEILADKVAMTLTTVRTRIEGQVREESSSCQGPRIEYPVSGNYARQFAAQAQDRASAVAVQAGDLEMTYAELDRRSNQLAHFLQNQGVGPEVLVAVCLERSPELMIALLAIAKAGGAYLPLDPEYPAQRLAYMLEDSEARLLLTESRTSNLVQCPAEVRLVRLDDATEQSRIAGGAVSPTENQAGPDSLAYVIYTSGSTGRPKGVEITQRALLNHNYAVGRAYGLQAIDRVLQFAPISFDISVEEIFATWLAGGTVVLRTSESLSSAAAFLQHIARQRVTVLNLPTSFWHELVCFMHGSGHTLPETVRLVIVGGEKISDQTYAMWKECVGSAVQLINGYGVTEATVTSLTYEACPQEETLPIGRPIANTSVFVLDESMRLVAPGQPGELYIGGASVARGYLNRPELTRQKFVANPFSRIPGERLYRTGDMVRVRADGAHEFLGRVDDQVKIRGYRIELGEIEAALLAHPDIQAAAVICAADNQSKNRLVAHVVPRNGKVPQNRELVAFLKERLPAYMVPAVLIGLKAMPLTPAGKVDRAALPAPGTSRPDLPQAYAPPTTPAEEILADIWGQVLSIAPVGVHDNFFELGGDSLHAMQVVSRVRDSMHLQMEMSTIFSSPTISGLAAQISEKPQPLMGLPPSFKGRRLPISDRQRRIWFLDTFEPAQSPYNLPLALRLDGPLKVQELKRSLRALARRHEALRCVFPAENGEPVQYIAEHHEVQLPIIDLTREPEAYRESRALERMSREARRPYITSEPVLKTVLFRFSATEHWLLLVLHEIAVDSRSVRIVADDLAALYNAIVSNEPEPLRRTALGLIEAREAATEITPAQKANELEFWRKELAGAPQVLDLPADNARLGHRPDAGARRLFRIPAETAKALEALSVRAGGTLFTGLLSGFAVLLHRYTGSQDILIGSPVSLRTDQRLNELAGHFENQVVLRCTFKGDPTFREVLGLAQERTAAALRHSRVPFFEVIETVHAERNPKSTPLFQVALALDEPVSERVAGGVRFQRFVFDPRTAQVDLSLHLERRPEGGLAGWIEYSTDLFEPSRIARLEEHVLVLLKGLVTAPDQPISSAPLLSEGEHRLLREWNDTARDYSRTKTLADLFAEQAALTPAALALVSGEQRLTYAQLSALADRFAAELRRLGVGRETLVGICLERSPNLVAALLGCHRAGAAYVPLDPAYPSERLGYIARDAGLRVVITQQKLLALLPQTSAHILCLENVPASNAPVAAAGSSTPARPEDLAYVIYTSGSTGRPKGVAVEHRSAVAFVAWATAVFSPEELGGVLAATSICFDLSIFEIFVPLSCGAKVILAENALTLPQIPAAGEVTLINTVPSAIRELLRLHGVPASVQVVNLAGEPLPQALADQIYRETKVRKVYDLYGPTETTTYSTGALRQPGKAPTIGRPLSNEQVWLLDSHRQLVPIGIAGELYIAGAGLARGYLNNPEQTAERFVPHPFAPGERLYKTGDLARWRDDGNLEYLGRIDHQVKIRGFRIELGEIESVLKALPAVAETVVIAREDCPGDKRLVAYVVPKPSRSIDIRELRTALSKKVPEYMLPAAFVLLEKMPLTPNGKIDRRALPAPDREQQAPHIEFVAPRNPVERQLAGIWCEVLHLPEVGIRDSFFDLGGHSLLVIQMISRIREAFKVELPLFSVFSAPTIAQLAEGLAGGAWQTEKIIAVPLQKRSSANPSPLSFVQERLWFIHQLDPQSHAYNVPSGLRLQGALDAAALERAVNLVVQRHDVLRTTFEQVDSSLCQKIAGSLAVPIATVDLSGVAQPEQDARAGAWLNAEARKPFDLARGPLLRVGLARCAPNEHIFLLVMHHTISDGWSLEIFFQDLATAYDHCVAGKSGQALAPLPIQYADFASWQREMMQGPVLERELAFWKSTLAGAPPSVPLPTDHDPEAPSGKPKAGRRTAIIPDLARRQGTGTDHGGVTPFMILMGALTLTLHRWTEQKDLVVGTVVAGRNRREIENLIGCFMNFLPVRSRLTGSESARDFLHSIRTTVLEAQAHQDCPFEKIVEAVNPERRLDRNPLYNVALLLQNFPNELFAEASLLATPVPVDMEAPLLDLRFEVEKKAEGLSVNCEYRTDLFEAETIDHLLASYLAAVDFLAQRPEASLAEYQPAQGLAEQAAKRRERAEVQTVAVSATFTGEPLLEPLRFWLDELKITGGAVQFAPYGQVFQALLDPGSELGRNQRGLNVVLLRLEDWDGAASAGHNGDNPQVTQNGEAVRQFEEALGRNTREFLAAIQAASTRTRVPLLVCVCPPSPRVTGHSDKARVVAELEQLIERELEPISGVYVLASRKLADWYPVTDYYDANGEELGHVPYTPLFFSALGTAIARVFDALRRLPCKVIALDCDNTLWSGVCGEEGPQGIRLEEARMALQKFFRAQREAGTLLALCSKNNEEDVFDVFAQRAEMPLRREDFVSQRLNWQPKSENLKALARELRLGLDSFVFVDDNPVECAEVEANCPEVLALQLPEDPARIPGFLKHCWVFDHLKVTSEDRRRAESYQQEKQRDQLRVASSSLMDFINCLELKVVLEEMTSAQVPRVAQLTQRTNQFNTTTRRRSEADLRQAAPGWRVTTVSVSDRFGDYGLTGAMIHRCQGDTLEVDGLMLSCRVLGRGVEHRMVAWLGQLARAENAHWIDLHFVRSAKNKPALDFLDSIGLDFRQPLNGGYIYRLPVEHAEKVVFDRPDDRTLPGTPAPGEAGVPAQAKPAAVSPRQWARYHAIATEFYDIGQVHARVEQTRVNRHARQAEYVAPQNSWEDQLCRVWERLLNLQKVGIHDNFFDLGGHSLLAVRLFSEIEKLTGRKLPLITIFQAPTVQELARELTRRSADPGSLLVPIQPNGSKPPLFLVHGAGGDVLWGYANLAAHLPQDQPVYGIKSRGQLGLPEYSTVPDMARCYLEAVRAFQPEGPYYLGGYCFGGNVAYEMARQLRAAGEPVALVALVDSAPSNAGYERMTPWRPTFAWRFARNLFEWLKDFSRLDGTVRNRFLARKFRSFGRKLQRRFFKTAGPAPVDLEEVIDPTQLPENELKLWQIHLQALIEHVEGQYPGEVILLRTRGQPLFCSLEEDFCWGGLTQVRVANIPGSHENIFVEPNVRTLAKQVSDLLAEAQSAAEAARASARPALSQTQVPEGRVPMSPSTVNL